MVREYTLGVVLCFDGKIESARHEVDVCDITETGNLLVQQVLEKEGRVVILPSDVDLVNSSDLH